MFTEYFNDTAHHMYIKNPVLDNIISPSYTNSSEAYLFMDEHLMDLCDLKATAHKQTTGWLMLPASDSSASTL